jgi:DNA-binding SARP family transcriptional activator
VQRAARAFHLGRVSEACQAEVGGTLARTCRLYVAGPLTVEGAHGTLRAEDLPRRQGRLALAHLALHRDRPVTREQLAAALWSEDAPPSLDAGLPAVVSKLRRALASVGISDAITSRAGCYALQLPTDAWVDLEAAATELDDAEGALRRGDPAAAWAPATVATAILRRPLLPGEDAPWVLEERRRLDAMLLRASDVLAEAWLHRREGALAQRVAEAALPVAPFREATHRLLMRTHLAQGNRAEALLAFHRCRALLVEELGVEPDEETQRLYESALR